MRSLTLLVPFVALMFACAPATPEAVSDSSTDDDDALANTISSTLGPLKLTLQARALFEDRDGRRVLVIKGSANRHLENVFSFVPDDGFGTASLVTQRKFELVLSEGHEINTLLSGMPILMSVQTASGSPNSFVAQIALAPSFARFSGSSKIFISTPIEPVYVRDAADSLRYRGKVKVTGGAQALSVFTDDDNDPEVLQVGADAFQFDWRFDGFRLAADPPTDPVHFVADRATGPDLSKTAGIDIRVSGLELTTDDPYEVWARSCDATVWQCIQDAPASEPDLSHCGSYRDVQRCVWLDSCQVFGYEPLSLSPIDVDALEPAADAFNDGCAGGGDWCNVSSADAYEIGACAETPFGLTEIVDWVNTASQDQPQGGWVGQSLSRADLANTPFFGASYSSGGPGLLSAADEVGGSQDVQSWYFVEEVPCQNCHDFWAKAVLFYPATGRVIVVSGSYGYDS